MRIVHFSPLYSPATGGAESYLQHISEAFAAKGHQVTIVTSNRKHFEHFWQPDAPQIQQQTDWLNGVRILRFPTKTLPGSPSSYRAVRRLIWFGSKLRMPASTLQKITKLTPHTPALWHWIEAQKESFDLVGSINSAYENFALAGLQLTKKQGIPHVYIPLTHLGAGATPGGDPISSFYTMRHQLALAQQSVLSVMMTRDEQHFFENAGISKQKLPIVGPGVHLQQNIGGDGPAWRQTHQIAGPIIFTIASLTQDKGAMQLCRAFHLLRERGEHATLVLAGRAVAEFEPFWQQLPEGTRQHIRRLGQIDEQQKRDLLAAGDIFAMPSRADSFGMVYLEAWLNKKPVIGAQSWGVGSLIQHEKDGLLVPFGDAAALTDALTSLLKQPNKRQAFGQAGYVKAKAHLWPEKIDAIQRHYERLVA